MQPNNLWWMHKAFTGADAKQAFPTTATEIYLYDVASTILPSNDDVMSCRQRMTECVLGSLLQVPAKYKIPHVRLWLDIIHDM